MRKVPADPGPRGPRIRTIFTRWVAAVSVGMLAGTLVSVSTQQAAQAYSLNGCKWNTRDISYYVPSPLVSYPVWRNASTKWGSLDATLTWRNIANPHIYGTNENRGNTVAWTGATRTRGTVQTPPSCPNGLFQTGQVEVVLNWTSISGYTAAQKEGVAVHEFGHALGLAHNSTTSGGVPVAVMYPYDNLRHTHNVLAPKTDDRNGVNAIY